MSGIDMDWAEAERLWRRSGGLEDRLALVERALTAMGKRPARAATRKGEAMK